MTALESGTTLVTLTPETPVIRYELNAVNPLYIYTTGVLDTFCRVYDANLNQVAQFDDNIGGNFAFRVPDNLAHGYYYLDVSLYGQPAVNASFDLIIEGVIPSPHVQFFAVGNQIEVHLDIVELLLLDFREHIEFIYSDIINFFTVNNRVDTFLGHENVGIGYLGITINNSYAYQIHVPANWIQRNFIARIGDLILPISSLSASLSPSGGSYVTLSIPKINSEFLDAIIARKTQSIVVTRQHIYSDGSTIEREFIRVNYDTITSDTGAKSGTITLVGRRYIPVSASKTVTEPNAYYINVSDGKMRYRMPVNDEAALGDLLLIDNTEFIIGKITHYISVDSEFMECTEYVADGADNSGIGSNVRTTPLQAYLVTETNPNYFLWQAIGYLYNGRANNPADSTNYTFTLWYDVNGLLWYIANQPVLNADNTQASINV